MLYKLLGVFLIIFLMFNTTYAANDVEKVIIYNWSDYMPAGVLQDFTEETGIEVEYSTYDSNEVMFAKLGILEGRGYDVIVPSTDFVEKMYKEGLLHEIDKELVDNLKYLDKGLLNRGYDPHNKYSIPYLFGSTAIAVNSNKIDATKIKYWHDLWDKKWNRSLLFIDDMRSIFHMAFKINGHSSNSQNKEEIKQAYELLKPLMKNFKILTGDKPGDRFLNNDVYLGTLWNGEAADAQSVNSAIKYIYPKEGAIFWIDSFVIPSQASNIENAHTFINYMLRPDIAIRCVNELGYATPNVTAKMFLDDNIKKNPIIFPPQNLLEKAEFPRDVGNLLKTYSLYWDKLKTYRQ